MKKLKFLVGAVALFALVVVNVWNATTVLKKSTLDVSEVEVFSADAEDMAIIEFGTYWYGVGIQHDDEGRRYALYVCAYNPKFLKKCGLGDTFKVWID